MSGNITPGTENNSVSQIPTSTTSVPVPLQRYPSNPNATRAPVVYKHGAFCCLNVQLQTACTIISFIGIILGLLFLTLGGILLVSKPKIDYLSSPAENKDEIQFSDAIEHFGLVQLVRGFYYLMFYPALAIGSCKRQRTLCKVWIWIEIVMLILIISATTSVAVFHHFWEAFTPLIFCILEAYFIFIVLCFVEELKVVGVVGGQPEVVNEDIFDQDIFNMGIYGPGTASGEQVNPPQDYYYPKILVNNHPMNYTTGSSETIKTSELGAGSASSIESTVTVEHFLNRPVKQESHSTEDLNGTSNSTLGLNA